MAPITQLSVLAFAAAALAVPNAHVKRHAHPGAPPAYGGAPPAYGASSSSAAPASSSAAAMSSSAPASAPPSYGSPSSSEVSPVSSSAPAGYGASSSSAAAVSSSAVASSASGPAGYGSSSSEAAAVSSSGAASWSGIPSSGYATPSGYSHPTGSYASGTGVSIVPTGGYSGPASYSTCTETSTLIYRSTTEYSTYVITHTIYPEGGPTGSAGSSAAPTGGAGSPPAYSAPAGSGAAGGAGSPPAESAPVGGAGSPPAYSAPASAGPTGGAATSPAGGVPVSPAVGTCAPDVTVTTTVKSTIYVSGGAAPTPSNTYRGSWEPAPSPSTPAVSDTTSYRATWAPAPSASSPAAAPPAYSSPAASSAAASSAAPSPPAYSSPAASSPVSSSPAPSSSAPSSPPSPGNSGYNGKRGLAYNDASLTNMFANSSYVGWSYNWGSDNGGLDSGVPYIPTMWGTAEMWTSVWDANAQTALDAGAKYFFSFNEPDMVSQANLSPAAAVEAWNTYMEPYAGKVKLVAPGVTNGQGDGLGLSWLQEFLSLCTDCTIDAVAQHWYWDSNDAGEFKTQIQATIDAVNKPIWVNEFGAVGTDEEKSEFLTDVMGWMDSNDDILGYAYFMVSDGLLCNGDAPSAYGATYSDASS